MTGSINKAWIKDVIFKLCRFVCFRSVGHLAISILATLTMLPSPAFCLSKSSMLQNGSIQGTEDKKTQEVLGEIKDKFLPPYPFSKEEFLVNLGRILLTKDGRVEKKVVEQVFQLKIPEQTPYKSRDSDANKLLFLLLPWRDWYLGMELRRRERESEFQVWFDSYFCISILEFRRVALDAGWELQSEARLYGHHAQTREYYRKSDTGAEMFFDMSRPYLQCIESVYVVGRW